jgi:outer membrane beta-barrel protein
MMVFLRISVVLAGLAFVGFSAAHAADEEKTKPAGDNANASTAGAGGEVDISDVQNQYWKSHDKEFEVIQNKQYTKQGRLELTPLFGLYQRVDFQDTKTLGGSLAYHFTETMGAEFMSYSMYSSDSHVVSRFKEQFGTGVSFNPEHYFAGLSFLWTPIYAKFSFLGKKISHFDMYVAPGGGIMKTNTNRATMSLGVGEKFWITPKWNLRVEYRWMRYGDRIFTDQGAAATKNGGPGFFDDTINDQNLLFGISYLFN